MRRCRSAVKTVQSEEGWAALPLFPGRPRRASCCAQHGYRSARCRAQGLSVGITGKRRGKAKKNLLALFSVLKIKEAL